MSTGHPENNPHREKIIICLSIILVLGLAVRLIYLWQSSAYPNFFVPYAGADAVHNHEMAQRVAGGDILLGKDVYWTSPLYAYFLGGLFTLFGDSYWIARLANVILGVGTIALIYLFTLRFFQSAPVALLAGLGASIYGPFIVFDTSGLKASLGLFFTALMLYMLTNCLNREARSSRWLYAGMASGLVFNIIGQIGIFLLLLCRWLFIKRPCEPEQNPPAWNDLRSRLRRVSLFILGIILVIAPFTIRNYYVAGDTVLIGSNSGLHLYIGNHKGASGKFINIDGLRHTPKGHIFDAKRIAEEEAGHTLSASKVSAFWMNRAYEFVRDEPAEFLRLLGKKTLLVLSSYEIPGNDNYQYLKQRSSFLSYFPGIEIMLTLGLCGLLLGLLEYRKLEILFIFFFTYSLALILTLVSWRYRMPLTLVLIPFAGYFIVQIFEAVKRKAYIMLVLVIPLTAGAWTLTQASSVEEQYYAVEMKRAEARMNMSDREHKILTQLETDTSLTDRDVSRLLVKQAELRKKQLDIEGSVDILQKALALHPDQPRQWWTLTGMLRRLGRTDASEEAKANFEKYRKSRRSKRR